MKCQKNFVETKAVVIRTLRKGYGIIKIKDAWYEIHRGIPDAIARSNQPVFMYAGGFSNDGNPYAFVHIRLSRQVLLRDHALFLIVLPMHDVPLISAKSTIYTVLNQCTVSLYAKLLRRAYYFTVVLQGRNVVFTLSCRTSRTW